MTRQFDFWENHLMINLPLNANIEILSTPHERAYLLITSDQDENLIFEHSNNTFLAKRKEEPSLYDAIDAVVGLFKRDESSIEKIKALASKSIEASIKLFVNKSTIINMKLNSGNISISTDINKLDIKGNSLNIKSDFNIKDANIKINSGNIMAIAKNNIASWNISINKGTATIITDNFDGTIFSKVNNIKKEYLNKNQRVINIKINSGSLHIS